ncbi:MAG: segregation/condensation protein A, partial [Erysipelotrichaceae bacterium]|nr:segregation/condensation protein A [Erysipelotrichaceae bacterium]
MGFEVETLKFEGPLDLMLHLIHEQQLDIFDLDMEILTDQYIRYLHAMEDLHLEVESEYLVELATLIEYKSKKLLPKKEDEADDNLEDPKDKLVRRLLEYQKY